MINLYTISKRAERAALDIIWDHWGLLGYPPPSSRPLPKKSLVDPEALLLLSLYLYPADDRLDSVITWWAKECASRWSVQRIKRMLPLFPENARNRLAECGAPAAAGDPRWLTLAVPQKSQKAGNPTDHTTRGPVVLSRESVRSHRPLILGPAALILRSRLLFGVNPRADVIVYLLSRGTQTATVPQIATTTMYSRSSIYETLVQLLECRLAVRLGKRPQRYLLCADAWREVFGREVIREGLTDRFGFRRDYSKKTAARMWLCWPQVFSFLALLREIGCEDEPSSGTPEERVHAVIRASLDYERTFFGHGLKILLYFGLDPRRLRLLDDSVDIVSAWYRTHS